MQIADSVALVTGSNRGLGRQFARTLLDRGAAKVYATARRPESIDLPGVITLPLDITDPESVQAAAAAAGDTTLLINNAGSATGAGVLTGDVADLRLEMETHYFGTLAMSRAFAPILARNGGGALLNVLSVLSWRSLPSIGGYAVAKSAAWSATSALRLELAGQGTLVSALHVGYMDTDMAAHVTGPKSDPALIAALALDGIEKGEYEIIADEFSANVKAQLPDPVIAQYPQLVQR